MFSTAADLVYVVPGSLCMVITAVVSPIQSQLYGRAFGVLTNFLSGKATVSHLINEVRLLCGLVIAVGGARMVFTWTGVYLWMIFGERQQKRAREQVFSALMRQEMAWFDKKQNLIGLMTQTNRCIEEVRAASLEDVALVIQSGFAIIFLLVSAFISLWLITLVVMASAPLMAASGTVFGKLIFRFASSENNWSARCSKVLDWSFGSAEMVRLLSGKFHDLARFSRLVDGSAKAFTQTTLATCCNTTVLRMLSFLVFVQGFWFGEAMIKAGKMEISNVFSAFSSSLLLGSEVSNISTIMAELNRGQAAAATISEFIDLSPDKTGAVADVAAKPSFAPSTIRLRQVSFAYEQTKVLHNISWLFSSSALNFVVGKSGCGKSSLVLLLAKFYRPTSGDILLDDILLADISDDILPTLVCLVEPSGLVFDAPLSENLAFGRQFSESTLLEACDFAELMPFVDQLKDGVYTNVSSSTLLGGQIQRIGLARAFLRNPPVLVLDEALSAIDILTRNKIQKKLRQWRKNCLTIVITHDLSDIETGDHIMALEDGQLCEPDFTASPNPTLVTEKKEENIEKTEEIHTYDCEDPPVLRDLEKRSSDLESNFEEPSDLKVMSVFHILRYCIGTIRKKSLVVLGVVLSVVSGVSTPILSYCFSKLLSCAVDASAKTGKNEKDAVFWSAISIALVVVDGIIYFISRFSLDYASEMWVVELRKAALGAIDDQDMTIFGKKHMKPAELTTLIMNDSRDLRNLVSQFPSACMSLVALTLVGVIWAIASGWKLALVGVAFVPAIGMITVIYGWLLSACETSYKLQVAVAETLEHNVASGIRTVKAWGVRSHFSRAFSEKLTGLRLLGRRRAVATGFGLALQELCVSLATGAVLYYGLVLVGEKQYTHATMLLVLTLLSFALLSASTLMHELPDIARGQRAGTLFLRILALEPGEIETSGLRQVPHKAGSLRFHRVLFGYGTEPVLTDFCAEFAPGEVVGLIGPSGCGKSTVALLCGRLYAPDSGQITYCGVPISEFLPGQYRAAVSVVPQHSKVFEGTVRENLLYGNDNYKTPDEHLQRCLDVCNFPLPLDTALGGSSSCISLGQLQRLCIARALVKKPKVMVFDESTANLDTENKKFVAQLITEKLPLIDSNIIVVAITHDRILMDALPAVRTLT